MNAEPSIFRWCFYSGFLSHQNIILLILLQTAKVNSAGRRKKKHNRVQSLAVAVEYLLQVFVVGDC